LVGDGRIEFHVDFWRSDRNQQCVSSRPVIAFQPQPGLPPAKRWIDPNHASTGKVRGASPPEVRMQGSPVSVLLANYPARVIATAPRPLLLIARGSIDSRSEVGL
jgi:hypothetical protein